MNPGRRHRAAGAREGVPMALDPAFEGTVPALFERFGVPMLFAPYVGDLVQRLGGLAEGRVLETAAGTGVVTRALLAGLPAPVRIVATDLSQAMLDHAMTQVSSDRLSWQQADAQALPFADSSFDAVVCQFGVMFFADKVRGFAEAFRVLRPGGRFLFSVWDRIEENALTDTTMRALDALFPDDPPVFMRRIPHGFHDAAALERMLREAGFGAVASATVRRESAAPDAAAVARFMCQGSPMSAEIEARAPGRLEAITGAVAAAITERHGAGPVTAPMQAIVLVATR